MKEGNVYQKLLSIQTELKAPKGQYNSFGKYKYRSCENILEAVKPLCKKYNCLLVLSDEIEVKGDNNPTVINYEEWDKDAKKLLNKQKVLSTQRYYTKATATLYDLESNGCISNTANAREEEEKKGMDGSQITGTASSYARKYALNGLFAIDDNKDSDNTNKSKKENTTLEDFIDKAKSENKKIDEGQKQRIEFAIEKGIISLEDLLKYFKVKNLEDLSFGQALETEEIIRKKEKKNSKEKEEVF